MSGNKAQCKGKQGLLALWCPGGQKAPEVRTVFATQVRSWLSKWCLFTLIMSLTGSGLDLLDSAFSSCSISCFLGITTKKNNALSFFLVLLFLTYSFGVRNNANIFLKLNIKPGGSLKIIHIEMYAPQRKSNYTVYSGVSCISKLLSVTTYKNIAMKNKNSLLLSLISWSATALSCQICQCGCAKVTVVTMLRPLFSCDVPRLCQIPQATTSFNKWMNYTKQPLFIMDSLMMIQHWRLASSAQVPF